MGVIRTSFIIILIALSNIPVLAQVQVLTVDNRIYNGEILSISSDPSPSLALNTQTGRQEISCLDIVEIELYKGDFLPVTTPRIIFNDQSVIYGQISGGSPTNISILSQSLGTFIADLEKVQEIIFPYEGSIREMRSPGNDILYLKAGDRITGVIDSFTKGSVRLQHEQLGLVDTTYDKLAKISFARLNQPPAPPTEFVAIIVCTDRSRLTGKIVKLSDDMLQLNPTYLENNIDIPLKSIKTIHFRNGRFVYLSDFPPSSYKIEFVPYFPGDNFPLRVDLNATGHPIKLKDKVFLKGFGAYPHTEITFTITENYKRFQAFAGIDDEAASLIENNRFSIGGSVVFQVYLDKIKKFDSGIVRCSNPVIKIDLDIEKVKELKLVVDYGDNAHCNDLADWAGTRFIK